MPKKLTETQISAVKDAWVGAPFADVSAIQGILNAQGHNISSNMIRRHYPWDLGVHKSIRQHQASVALQRCPGTKLSKVYTTYGISHTTLKAAQENMASTAGFQGPARITVKCGRCDATLDLLDNGWTSVVCIDCGGEVAHPRSSKTATNSPEPVAEWPDDVSGIIIDRGKDYGHPIKNFHRNAVAFGVISECKDPEVRHALFNIWAKCCRLIETPDHKDSIDDIEGYAKTIHMIHEERKNHNG